MLALAAVVAVIFALGWLVKRARLPGLSSAVPMRTVGVLHVGARERVMIVEIGAQWHVLGVTQQSINAIGTMAPVVAPPPVDGAPKTPIQHFGQLLAERLKGSGSKP